jgi:hypothetical protein
MNTLLCCSVTVVVSLLISPTASTAMQLPRPPSFHGMWPEFVAVSDGATERIIDVEQLVAIPGRLEITTIAVPQTGAVLQIDNEAVLEVRGGRVETVINGERQQRVIGDMWLVAPNTNVTLKVLGEAAVLRAIYFIR